MVSVLLTTNPKPNSGFKYGFEFKEQALGQPASDQAVVKIQAAAFNHRDIWILKGQYPAIIPGSVPGSDGVGIVTSETASFKQGQRVLINPGSGWDEDERAPEQDFKILGLLPCIGTFTDSVVVDTKELLPCPEHLSTAEAAALPLAGLTAYRALFTKAKVRAGEHVLITGIGGGVALFALQFAVAAGAHVYVTSSNPDKIEKAIQLGAKGGVNYKDENCISELKKLLNGNLLSAIIDGAGGPLYEQYPRVMRTGGIIANYGQTVRDPAVHFTALAFIKNIELRGTTMGSRAEFKKMVAFVDAHKIKPIVSQVWQGLTEESVDEAVRTMANGEQFGKLVIQIGDIDSPHTPKL
ncbi:uncharacterized protein BX664DRAFT_322481 [Halteromyces radiatus]|uniref:uncharacterized protein n=1 Tax=Halteromyces radiatus TaxID=101107 RepID=UPI0022205615|nr:uncharacterized protein BX664DRAFT_322481 [Halteromyces radiatus]KAI8099951.1 hypothetical protein BX664DRAFT_322481 [Halteromyces radiatus]